MSEDCLFCKIYKEGKEIFYENESFYSRFDMFPISPGHTEVIPKRHAINLLDLTEKEWNNLKPALKETVEIIESLDSKRLYKILLKNPVNNLSEDFCRRMLDHPGIDKKPDAYNFGNNDGEAAGRTIHHLHIHIIPRYKGDVENPRGGIRHIIPELGDYKG
ncbi:HIT domain-containing protein [Candidatus Woesearchaeota archaeon]|nr:HIT domain-containing protein [Candidatus Woesearchaeota archaeon]